MKEIDRRASFEIVRYANAWEDPEILLEALAPRPDSNCLSIASAGDNSFALLARAPALVVAVDISAVQLACVEIRRAAYRALDHEGFIGFLGFRSSADDRGETYRALREHLSPDARGYWDRNVGTIRAGIIHAGKFERYFALFRDRVLPLVHGRRDVAELLRPKTLEQRREFYSRRWDGWRWRLIFKVFFSRFVMGRMGRDPEFFRYVEGSVAERILARAEYALTELPTHDNPFINYILTGSFGQALPFYARHENFGAIRDNLERLELVHGDVGDALRRFDLRFDAWNLSDIFEYMERDLFLGVASEILSRCNDGARLAYWNMLVPRRISEVFPDAARHLGGRSEELFMKDKAFFYQAFHIDEYRG